MSYYTNPHGHQCPWYPYSELLGYPSANWCEETSCYWVSEPISTYSSLAFILLASILFAGLKKKNHPDLKLFLNLFLFIGVGAAIYHASLNYFTQLLAHGFIYAFIGGIFLKNLMRQGKISYSQRNKFLIGFVAVFLIVEHILYSQFVATQILIPIGYLLVITSELATRRYEEARPKYKLLLSGFVVLIVAEIFSMMDLFKIQCNPKSLYFQGHALWHVLAAVSFALLYLHIYQFYAEKSNEPEVDFDNYEEDDSIEVEQVENEVEEYESELEENNSLQFDSMLDLNEEPELDEEEEEQEVQIQFNFDEAEATINQFHENTEIGDDLAEQTQKVEDNAIESSEITDSAKDSHETEADEEDKKNS